MIRSPQKPPHLLPLCVWHISKPGNENMWWASFILVSYWAEWEDNSSDEVTQSLRRRFHSVVL